MNVIVATKKTQSARPNDFSFAEPNELVRFGSECDGETVDGSCGCKRSLVGVSSGKGTTTFKVAQAKITLEEFKRILRESFKRLGWQVNEKEIESEATILLQIAASFEVGDILERRAEGIMKRPRVIAHD